MARFPPPSDRALPASTPDTARRFDVAQRTRSRVSCRTSRVKATEKNVVAALPEDGKAGAQPWDGLGGLPRRLRRHRRARRRRPRRRRPLGPVRAVGASGSLYHRDAMIAPPRDEAELLARALALRGRPWRRRAYVARARWASSSSAPSGPTAGRPPRGTSRARGRAQDNPRRSCDADAARVDLRVRRFAGRRRHGGVGHVLGSGEALACPVGAGRGARGRPAFESAKPACGRRPRNRSGSWPATSRRSSAASGWATSRAITAHVGRWLQLRPKAAHGRVRTLVRAAEGSSWRPCRAASTCGPGSQAPSSARQARFHEPRRFHLPPSRRRHLRVGRPRHRRLQPRGLSGIDCPRLHRCLTWAVDRACAALARARGLARGPRVFPGDLVNSGVGAFRRGTESAEPSPRLTRSSSG